MYKHILGIVVKIRKISHYIFSLHDPGVIGRLTSSHDLSDLLRNGTIPGNGVLSVGSNLSWSILLKMSFFPM